MTKSLADWTLNEYWAATKKQRNRHDVYMLGLDHHAREQDLMDQYALGQITRDEFVKLHEEWCGDYHQAMSTADLIDQQEQSK